MENLIEYIYIISNIGVEKSMGQFDLMKMNFSKLERLLIYRNILKDDIFSKVLSLILSLNRYINHEHSNTYYQLCHELLTIAEEEGFQGDLLQCYILKLIATDENPFSLACEKYGFNVNPGLFQAAIHDLTILKEIIQFTLADIGIIIGVGELSFISHYSATSKKSNSPLDNYYRELKQTFFKEKPEQIVEMLADFYFVAGSGLLCQYSSFRLDDNLELVGVTSPNTIKFDDIIGYEDQKKRLIENTETFLRGRKANNVLLYGDSGTGKSSSIKALINKFYDKGLRLIEIKKEEIKYIPYLLERLNKRGLYFILYMDDLSFEDFETEYKYLKAVMEGGVEEKPDNVLFYATSNRKHIVKEKWQDRNEVTEIHQADGLEEKLSLSERFGITITFLSPDQKEYLEIVKRLAVKNKLYMPEEELVDMALKWEKWHHGRSGRTARQFINYLLGKNVS